MMPGVTPTDLMSAKNPMAMTISKPATIFHHTFNTAFCFEDGHGSR
jgi:hypothetical protein